MKSAFYKRSFVFSFCAGLCFAATFTEIFSQGQQQQPALLALKACSRELRVFDDGAVFESLRGKTTQRRLTKSQLRKLREVINRRPCIKQWQQPTSPPPVPAKTEIKFAPADDDDCVMDWVSYGGGLDEIQITISSSDGQIGPFPVYVVCDGAKESYKRAAKRNYQRSLKPVWRRFIADVSKAVGGKSFLKGCDCWRQ